jgi:P2-related tail formation protein
MVDLAAIAGLVTSVRSAVEITKAMKDVNDANIIQTKVFELTREILATQGYALEAQAAQSELLRRVRELEEEKTKLEAWTAEKGRYDFARSVRAFTLIR